MSQLSSEFEGSNEQSYSQSPKSKKIKKNDSESPRKKNIGHWTNEEHEKYLKFLEDHAHLKKNNKIFKPMSEIIGTRSPSQCRSHHQKFNPMSPVVQRKIQKVQKKSQQTPFTLQDDTNFQLEDDSVVKNMVQLMIYDEDDQPNHQQLFNLDEFL